MKTKTLFVLAVATIMLACSSKSQIQTFGEEPSLKTPAQIVELNANPALYVDHDVLIKGKVVDMCRHAGCWVEIEQADNSKIICKSMDESVTFPLETLGKDIELQGTLTYDESAPGTVEEKSENGEEAHACPAPQVLVAIKGARVKGI